MQFAAEYLEAFRKLFLNDNDGSSSSREVQDIIGRPVQEDSNHLENFASLPIIDFRALKETWPLAPWNGRTNPQIQGKNTERPIFEIVNHPNQTGLS